MDNVQSIWTFRIGSKDVQHLVHELQVQQIELEMQNEELRRTQSELEDSLNRYSSILFKSNGKPCINKKLWISHRSPEHGLQNITLHNTESYHGL
jgi:hypothetical protein